MPWPGWTTSFTTSGRRNGQTVLCPALRAACELGRLLADDSRAVAGRDLVERALRDIPDDVASPDLAEARALLAGC